MGHCLKLCWGGGTEVYSDAVPWPGFSWASLCSFVGGGGWVASWFVSVRLAEFQSKDDGLCVPWLQVVVLLVFYCRVSGLLSCSLLFRSLSLSLSLSATFVMSSLFLVSH